MAQQVDLPAKEVHRFDKSRCLEVTRKTEHYFGGKIIPTDVISPVFSTTAIDAGVLMACRKSVHSI